MTPEWLLAWWRVFGDSEGRRLRAVLVEDGGRLVGLAPLLLRAHRYRPGIPFRRLELVASGEREEDEICSDYLSVLAATGAEREVADALAEALAGGTIARWDELLLPAMSGDAIMPLLLAGALRLRGLDAAITQTGEAPYVTLPETFDAYVGGLSKRRRYLVRRSLRDLDAWANGKLTLERVRDAADLPRGRAILESLHSQRWQGDGREDGAHGGVFASAKFRAFHDAVMPALWARGAMDLSWIAAAGTPIAIVYSLVWAGRMQVYQSGRRLDLPATLRPGLVVHARLIEAAIAAGFVEYDFLNGASRYKRDLTPISRPLVQLRAVRAPLRETARVLAAGSIAMASAWRDRLRGGRDTPDTDEEDSSEDVA